MPFAQLTASGMTESPPGEGFPAAPISGPAEAALHLVEEEQEIVPIAKRSREFQVVRACGIDADFTLDRLEKDRGDAGLLHGGQQGGAVIEGRVDESLDHRLEALLHLFLAGGCDAGERAPME
jgi:hypothetical protein